MKDTTFNRNSWHFKLASFIQPNRMDRHRLSWDPVTICQYTRWVILGALVVLAAVAIATFLVYGSVTGIYALIVGAAVTDLSRAALAMLGGITAFVALCLFAWAVNNWLDKLREKRESAKPKDPGFLVRAYRAHKEKFCYRVKFDSEE